MAKEAAMAHDERSRLGRGLAALIGDVGDESAALERTRSQKRVPIEFLKPNPRNPRRHFAEPELEELAASIRERGIIQPILVPLQCEFFALEGLSQLLKTVEQVKTALNPGLSIHGVVLTMFDARNNLSGQVVADVRSFMGEKVYETIIPRNVRISEAPSHGKPVLLYDLKCVGSQAYLRLASEIIQREKRLRAA